MAEDKTKFVVAFISEFTGTSFLVAFGCLIVTSSHNHTKSHFEIALGFGLVVLLCAHICGPLSGGHLNPWISTASCILGHLKWYMYLLYLVAQFLGGLAGYSAVYFVTPSRYFDAGEGLCVANSKEEFELWRIMFGEFLATSVLIFTYCGCADKRNAQFHEAFALRYGFVVLGLMCCEGYYSGTSINIARPLPPVVYHGGWKELAYFFGGQSLGAVVVALAWRFIFTSPYDEDDFDDTK